MDMFLEVRVACLAFLWTMQQMQQVLKKKPRVDLRTAGNNEREMIAEIFQTAYKVAICHRGNLLYRQIYLLHK